MSSGGVGRFGGSGWGSDGIRFFNRALELLTSNSPESENELLDMVKRSKETEEPVHVTKKVRSSRGTSESSSSEPPPLGHTSSPMAPVPMDHTSGQPSASWSDVGSGTSTSAAAAAAAAAAAGGSGSMTQAQARLMNVIRGGPGRGRIEKPKRKVTRGQ